MSDPTKPSAAPKEFAGVTVVTKANLYFDGGVASHTLIFPDGSKKTIGLIRPGSYHFNTGAPERMEITTTPRARLLTCRADPVSRSKSPAAFASMCVRS
jgi:uncharacterized protein YaiE (UPF0345 family)